MSVRKIFTLGDSLLQKVSAEVLENDTDIIALTDDMLETMQTANGLGLAAPQVGVLKRVIIIDFGYLEHDLLVDAGEKKEDDSFEPNPVVLINPVVTSTGKKTYTMEEGCLSIPLYRAKVTRSSEITCKYTTIDGKRVTKLFKNLGASAIQHEIDHLDGILFVNHIGRLKRNSAQRTVKKFLATVKETGSENERRLYGNA